MIKKAVIAIDTGGRCVTISGMTVSVSDDNRMTNEEKLDQLLLDLVDEGVLKITVEGLN